MSGYAESILRLPGTAEEKNWLREHLEVLSIAESDTLAAVVERSPPVTMADAVNHLLTLDGYDVYSAGSYEALGEFYLREHSVPQEQQAFFDKSALGQWYEDEHPGLFIGHHYIAYPKQELDQPYDGTRLPADVEMLGWSVRLKLASEAVPEGVWVKLPDYDEMNDETVSDLRLALNELRVGTIYECTLLDAKCVLPCVQDLASQYDNLADLIYDGQNLGAILDERGQGDPNYLEWFFAALEFENCRRLDDAVSIAENLRDYEVVSVDTFVDNITQELSRQAWAKAGDGVKGCFDYTAYAAALAEQKGYCLTDDGQNYIKKRDSPQLEQQREPTMTM